MTAPPLSPDELARAARSRRALRVGTITLFVLLPASWWLEARVMLLFGMVIAPAALIALLGTYARCPRCHTNVAGLYLFTGAHPVDLRCPPLRRFAQRDPVNA